MAFNYSIGSDVFDNFMCPVWEDLNDFSINSLQDRATTAQCICICFFEGTFRKTWEKSFQEIQFFFCAHNFNEISFSSAVDQADEYF